MFLGRPSDPLSFRFETLVSLPTSISHPSSPPFLYTFSPPCLTPPLNKPSTALPWMEATLTARALQLLIDEEAEPLLQLEAQPTTQGYALFILPESLQPVRTTTRELTLFDFPAVLPSFPFRALRVLFVSRPRFFSIFGSPSSFPALFRLKKRTSSLTSRKLEWLIISQRYV